MARRRFRPDPNFQMIVSRAVSGVGFTGRSSIRRRRTTLEAVAEAIIEEAQRITVQELPGYVTGGRHNPNSDFRRREREPGGGKPGPTYYSSFRYRIVQERGRLVFIVYNNHPHAQEIESGIGGVVHTRGGDRYFALPISKRKYAQLVKKSKVLSPEQKNRRRQQSALSYYRRREKQLKREASSLRRLGSRRRANPNTRARLTRQQLIDRAAAYSRNRARVRSSISALEGSLGDPMSPHSFPVLAPNGKAYLYTKSFRSYGGYGILRTAMRRVTLRELE